MNPLFTPYLQRWQLEQDGKAFETHSSLLMPVRYRGEAAMLKIAREQEERFGGQLMCWWRGEGAAQVLAWHDDGILLERAQVKVRWRNWCVTATMSRPRRSFVGRSPRCMRRVPRRCPS